MSEKPSTREDWIAALGSEERLKELDALNIAEDFASEDIREAVKEETEELEAQLTAAEQGATALREALRNMIAVVEWHSAATASCPQCGPTITAARKAVSASPVPPSPRFEWRPIETVPQDNIPYVTSGTLVLLCDAEGNYGLMYGFVAKDGRWTHWMPLPVPPSQKAGER